MSSSRTDNTDNTVYGDGTCFNGSIKRSDRLLVRSRPVLYSQKVLHLLSSKGKQRIEKA
ncbi:hypothetical protein J5X98_24415 [Leptothermofonsia sichuanensis E412]|uniref:hypothetical protein n=1 Tax=Leptothermofonsia sichuanensis TaxID=2917832 RepID=UPI001CA7208A|nr:hypothetical protein [Leptothermofonsia sichuanensis]QZZ20362.1 hypothetical protein J5X98_24415 [Leptothermofonsia sichuanensis E412]